MGIICCDSFTTDGSGNATVTTPQWEPQLVMAKPSSATGNWDIYDMMRGTVTVGNDAVLSPNLSSAEVSTADHISFTALGFDVVGYQASTTYIYMCIRRPNKPPESGSEVFAVDQGDSSGTATVPEFLAGFPVDMALRKTTGAGDCAAVSRLTQGEQLWTDSTIAATVSTAAKFDSNIGWWFGAFASTFYSWMFRRAPGFFDVVCYTGNGVAGREVAHNLGVVPEMMIVKCRSNATTWAVYHADNTAEPSTEWLQLNSTAATEDNSSLWADTVPTSSVFTIDNSSNVNENNYTYIAYLFATLAGISCVSSYTGNGTSQTIDCGFSAGARFILIKRIDSTGDWFIWDSTRGIVAGNDPHLSLNTTAAEVTTDDSVDPENSGFIVNQVAATNINVNTATYIFYAVA